MSRLDWLRKKIDRVNSVIKFFHDPCEAPFTMYIELAKPAKTKLVLGLLTFGLDDVFRGFARPRGLLLRTRTGRRRGRGRLSYRYRMGIPEIGEMLGHNIPGAEKMATRGIHQLAKWLWIVDYGLQRVLYYILIIDLITDFLYEWTTLIGKSGFCQRQNLTGAFLCDLTPTGVPRGLPTPLACRSYAKSWGSAPPLIGPIHYAAPYGVTCVGAEFVPWADEWWRVLEGVNVWIEDVLHPGVPIAGPIAATPDPFSDYWHGVLDCTQVPSQRTVAYAQAVGRNALCISGYIQGYGYAL